MEMEVDASKTVSNLFLKKERDYKDEITLLQRDKVNLQRKLDEEIERNRIEKERMEKEGTKTLLETKKEIKKYKEIVEKEIDLLHLIAQETKKDRNQLLDKIKEIQAILRTPRLWRQYQDKINNMKLELEQ